MVLLGVTAIAWALLDVPRIPAERDRIRKAGLAQRQHAQGRLGVVLNQHLEFFAEWHEHAARLPELCAWDPMGK